MILIYMCIIPSVKFVGCVINNFFLTLFGFNFEAGQARLLGCDIDTIDLFCF